jgi:hypothetical protein
MRDGIRINGTRKRMVDPDAEALASHKEMWNNHASELIWKLIAFKKGLNGRGDADAGIPPSRIKDPLPPEVTSYLGQLASEYGSLMQDASSIVHQQDQFSEHHRASSIGDSLEALSQLEITAGWVGDAASWVGNVGSGVGREVIPAIFLKKLRYITLVSARILKKQLEKIRSSILLPGTKGIDKAFYLTKGLGWQSIAEGWSRILADSSSGKETKAFIDMLKTTLPIFKDIDALNNLVGLNGFKSPSVKILRDYAKRNKAVVAGAVKDGVIDKADEKAVGNTIEVFVKEYFTTLKEANDHFKTNLKSFVEILESVALNKEAGALDWLRKQRLELSPFKSDIDQTKIYAIERVEIAIRQADELIVVLKHDNEDVIKKEIRGLFVRIGLLMTKMCDLEEKVIDSMRIESLDPKEKAIKVQFVSRGDIAAMRRSAASLTEMGSTGTFV